MRNRNGYTLVELLASIVVLGILMGVGIPILVNMLTNSRNKIYIEDAKKMVSKVEYKMKSDSSHIERPDNGDCIIISLMYIDDGEFDDPPHNGEYLKENSYVVVKNEGDKLKYAVTLIEKTKKNGYQGIDLNTYETLSSSNVGNKVTSFKASDLKTVGSDITVSYIRGKLGDSYLSSTARIIGSYNTVDLSN